MRPDDDEAGVLVIGGGAAGLSTAVALAKRGVRSTVLERDDRIGGSWECRYEHLRLHTVRRYSGLAYYPIPRGRPRYLAKDEYADYLREYAQAFELDVSLGEEVRAVRRAPIGDDGTDWQVQTNQGTRRAAVVAIATGHYAEPYLPAWEGAEGFAGTVLHSSDYITGAEYQGQNALVIGLGNSGAEISADLVVHGAASVSISVRTTPPIVTREMFGIVPVQLLGIALTPLRMPRAIDRLGAVLRRFAVGDLTPYGLGPAEWGPFTARKPAVIDVGFLKQLKLRRIVVRPEVSRFEAAGVVYGDGSREAVDVVVAATGFKTGLESILEVPGLLDDTGQPRFRSGAPTSAPGIYFIGFDETVRGHLYEANRDSRRLAVEISGYLTSRALM